MIEEPITAAAATESLSLPGREHREHGEHLAKVSPNLMHTQKTHLQTSPSAAPFITAEEEGVRNRVLTPVGRQGRGQEWTWRFLVPGAELGLSIFSCLPLSLPLLSNFSPTFSKAAFEKRRTENTNLLKMKPCTQLFTLLLFYNEGTGSRSRRMLMGSSQGLSPLAQSFGGPWKPSPMWDQRGDPVHYTSPKKAADPARNSSTSQTSGWAEPSLTISQPLWRGVRRGEERQTHPATDRESILHMGAGKEDSSTALYTDVWLPTAQQKPQAEVLVLVSAAARYIGHPAVKHKGLRWRFPFLPSKRQDL